MREIFVEANRIRFHCVEAGGLDAPLVLLLHGFPEFWYSWRYQVPALAEHFRVVAPDLRGYHLTDKPDSGYDLLTLTDDIAALIENFGAKQAAIVGHDWGGIIAWAFAHRFAERCRQLAILNAPHPVRYAEVARSEPVQLLKSWYALFFQLPWLPEQLLAFDDYAALEGMFRHPEVRPGSFSDADIREYKRAAAIPGALTAAINYYRALISSPPTAIDFTRPIPCPTQVIWGKRDFALEASQAEGLERFVSGSFERRWLPDCSHWVQQEDPTAVTQALVDFLTRSN